MLRERSYFLNDRKLENNSSDTSCGNATSRDTKSRSREGGAPSRVDARNGLKCFSEGIEAVGRKRRRRDAQRVKTWNRKRVVRSYVPLQNEPCSRDASIYEERSPKKKFRYRQPNGLRARKRLAFTRTVTATSSTNFPYRNLRKYFEQKTTILKRVSR